MLPHFKTIRAAGLCVEAASAERLPLQWRERVKEHLVELGEGMDFRFT